MVFQEQPRSIHYWKLTTTPKKNYFSHIVDLLEFILVSVEIQHSKRCHPGIQEHLEKSSWINIVQENHKSYIMSRARTVHWWRACHKWWSRIKQNISNPNVVVLIDVSHFFLEQSFPEFLGIILPLIITITNSSNIIGVFTASFFTNHSVQL